MLACMHVASVVVVVVVIVVDVAFVVAIGATVEDATANAYDDSDDARFDAIVSAYCY